MKNILIRVLGVAVLIGIISTATIFGNFWQPVSTAFAVGDLTIDWGAGITPGDPIFTVTALMPGQMEARTVTVQNDAPSSVRPVGVRGTVSGPDTLSPALEIVVSADGAPKYGAGSLTGVKTLQEFFTESAGPNGIELLTLPPGGSTALEFKVTFASTADNNFQNGSVTFDITIGIVVAVPAECSHIEFSGTPIFGTARGEILRGTPGNDLIFAFEGGDIVRGGGGDDCIVGGPGGDSLRGEGGNDVIFGNEGGDSLTGGAGDDRLFGGDGGDSLQGGGGNDYIEGNAGSDGLQGNAGNDTLLGGPGSDGASGGSGIDTCEAEGKTSCEL